MKLRRAASFVVVIVGMLQAALALGQEPIRFARHPDISPDGKLVAFSYLGDIWVVETIGGVAKPVTTHPAHDVYPVFSPDGKDIAFSSNRYGSYDVFVVSVQGGKPKRLTFDSASDIATGWSPDGKHILFTSTRSTDYPNFQEMFTVPADGGREKRISASDGREGVYSPKGDQIAYVRGPGTWYRKGYQGSSNDDIWICNADGTNNRQLTKNDRQDNSPMWSPDGQTVYYVSEIFGSPANVVKQDVNGKNPPQLVTFHKDDAVRRARINASGEWIVYECGFDIWVASTREGIPPRKLAIEARADDKKNLEEEITFTNGIAEYALTQDEKFAAIVIHGQIWGVPIPSGKPVRLTSSAAYDHAAAFSPDGTKMLFLSDRSGYEELYLLEPEEGGKTIPASTRFKQPKRILETHDGIIGAAFTPDGKRVSFVRNGKLFSMNPDGTDLKTVIDKPEVIDYEWSPDSRWLAFSRMDGSFASELYIMPAAGGEAKNVTRFATQNAGITWSVSGMKLAFLSERRQGVGHGLYVMSLQKPAAPGAPESNEIDWDDIHLRAELAAPMTAEQGAISKDGNQVAFRSVGLSGDDLWAASVDHKSFVRITNGNMRPHQIQCSRKLNDAVYFLDGGGQLRIATMSSSGTGGTAAVVPIKIKMTVRQEEEFTEMFDQSWRALSEHFYDPKFHGVDWSAIRNKYRPIVKHCAMKEDLYALVSLLMGELNASHLGIIPAPGSSPPVASVTADLGLIFDDSYAGPGLRIAEILKRGPADKRGINIKPSEVVVAIDDTELTDKINVSELLNGKLDERGKGEQMVVLEVVPVGGDAKDKKQWRKVEIMPTNRGEIHNLMYERWVAQNAAKVNELSKGKFGYIHIRSMDEAGLDAFVRSLYSDNLDKEAIVLDVRFNGGGFIHDQVLNYLGGKEHTIFKQRDGGEGWVLRSDDRKWSKPVILLINNRSFSDAEIFPSAFRTLGLGKLVGEPTGGFVIGTTSVRLIDGSTFRTPRLGVFTVKGVNMEKQGVVPDVVVDNHPDALAKGIDAQLNKAVDMLQGEVAEWKKKKEGGVPAGNGGGTPPPAGSGEPSKTPPQPTEK